MAMLSKLARRVAKPAASALTRAKRGASEVVTPRREPLTTGQTRVDPATRGQAVTRNVGKEGVGTGRVEGAVTVGGLAAAERFGEDLIDEILSIFKDPKARKSFGDAFRAASEAGDRTFKWRGKWYTTETAEKAIQNIIRPPKPKPQMKRGGVVGKKRTGHTDYRKGGLFYKGKK